MDVQFAQASLLLLASAEPLPTYCSFRPPGLLDSITDLGKVPDLEGCRQQEMPNCNMVLDSLDSEHKGAHTAMSDSYSRPIIIINYAERLDTPLIRLGRVDIKLKLKYIN